MAMPETAVDQNYGLEPREDQIRLTGKRLIMELVTEPPLMQAGPKHQFGVGILPLDAGHHPGTGSRINYIRHQKTPGNLSKPWYPYANLIKNLRNAQ
jgi:hypothetical protein